MLIAFNITAIGNDAYVFRLHITKVQLWPVQHSHKKLGGVQADVLVCARGGGGLLKERMALVADLWAAGLRAEMMQQAAPSLTAQYEYAHARHIPWLLIIHGATLSAADTVKVGPPYMRFS